jgi:hypothetical protein
MVGVTTGTAGSGVAVIAVAAEVAKQFVPEDTITV